MLGSGTTLPSVDRGPAGFLVQEGDTSVLVDGGAGTQRRLMQAGVDPRSLDGGVYSHWHPDHMGELVPLLFTFRVSRRDRAYPIVAGAGFSHILDGLDGVFGHWLHVDGDRVRTQEMPLDAPGSARIGEVEITTRPANHGAGALHLGFGTDRRVVFSGDTGPSQALVELATGADLFVCECAGEIDGHLSPAQVAEIVDAARPAAVWLTHFYPDVDPEAAVRTVAATGVQTRRANDLDVWP